MYEDEKSEKLFFGHNSNLHYQHVFTVELQG